MCALICLEVLQEDDMQSTEGSEQRHLHGVSISIWWLKCGIKIPQNMGLPKE